MGKVIPFRRKEAEVNIDAQMESFLDLFSDEDVQGLKDELDFLNELDDLGIDKADVTEES